MVYVLSTPQDQTSITDISTGTTQIRNTLSTLFLYLEIHVFISIIVSGSACDPDMYTCKPYGTVLRQVSFIQNLLYWILL